MKLFPEYSFELNFHAQPDELFQALSRMVCPSWNRFKYLRSHKIFAGTIMQDRFTLIRVDFFRTRLRPVIYGKILPANFGSKIMVRMGYDQGSVFFAVIFLLIVIYVLVNMMISNYLIAIVSTTIFSTLWWSFFWFDFKRECQKSRETFDNALAASETFSGEIGLQQQ
jgi:hypothetical protein